MNTNSILCKTFCALALFVTTFIGYASETSKIKIIPNPVSLTEGTGTYDFGVCNKVFVPHDMESVKRIVNRFALEFARASSIDLSIETTPTTLPTEGILFVKGSQLLPNAEGYKLKITPSLITIEAKDSIGFYYGLQTLKQMLPTSIYTGRRNTQNRWTVPAVEIIDYPRYGHRGFMLDVGRYFRTVDEVKRVLDVMSIYKMNRFHWHLTEDQGWRIEIKKYPKLTEIGSKRTASLLWGGSNDGIPYGHDPKNPMYYTQEQIKEVVAYAKERQIEIIPEIEVPGHFVAALAAYPELSCNRDRTYSVRVAAGISGDILNIGNETARNMVYDIVDEVSDLFPYNEFHVGGDEAPKGQWETNAECQALIVELSLVTDSKGSKENKLQAWFVNEIEKQLRAKGKKVHVWEEAIHGGVYIGSTPTVYSWTSTTPGINAIKTYGVDVIMTPMFPTYFSRVQWGGNEPYGAPSPGFTAKETYEFDPDCPNSLNVEQRKKVKGVQCCLWTEYIDTRERMEYMIFPRMIALSETAWTPTARKSWADFKDRLLPQSALLDSLDYHYGKHYWEEDQVIADNMPKASTEEKTYWHRINSISTDARAGKCLELMSTGADANKVFAQVPVTANEYQYWAIWKDANSGKYALVNRGKSGVGSLNPQGSAESNTARFSYNNTSKFYNFTIGERYAQVSDKYSFTIRSDKHTNYLNFAAAGQNFALNLWGNPSDGNSGFFQFEEDLLSGITDVKANELKAFTINGTIFINQSLSFEVYSTHGHKIANSGNLAKGVYWIRTEDKRVAKVVVQ